MVLNVLEFENVIEVPLNVPQGSHRLEKALNLKGCLEKALNLNLP